MSKYIKVEDIRAALIELSDSGKWLERETTTNIIKALGNLPTIEIVHCKYCNHWWEEMELCAEEHHVVEGVCGVEAKPTDFCSYGESE